MQTQTVELKRQQKLANRRHTPPPPAIRGSIKHHRPGNPLRPIVTCRNTALYNISKHLAHILSPLQNHNGYSVTNSTDFTKKLINTITDDDEIMISFDVVSLFTAIPVDRACERIRNKLNKDNTLGQRYKLSIDDIIKLLRFTLSKSYFTYNNETCKQIHGCAMGSPVVPGNLAPPQNMVPPGGHIS